MNRTIYHGSEFIINKPEYLKGNIHNDYGLGFYCCSNKALAREWASKKTGHGYINVYQMRDDRLKILDLTKPPFDNVLYWVSLLMHNRELSDEIKEQFPRELEFLEKHFLIDVKKYDVVIGYRADDSYFHFPEAFVKSEITLNSLNKVFMAGELGKQYVLISKRAFSLIKFIRYEETFEENRIDYYKRKTSADKTFKELLLADRYSDDIRLRDMIKKHE